MTRIIRKTDAPLRPLQALGGGERHPCRFPHLKLCLALLGFLFCFTIWSSAADLTLSVLDASGQAAADVAIQIFPGALHPDSDVEPIPPPQKRRDGLIGFVTDVQGQTRISVPAGEYTVAAFSPKNAHRFCLVDKATVPGTLVLDARRAQQVTVRAIDVNGDPIIGAGIYFRPARRCRGLAGFIGNDGLLQARISAGTYHGVLASSSFLYLVQPNTVVANAPLSVAFDVAKMPTAEILFELPEDPNYSFSTYPNSWPALYEVLETELTYEYVEAIEEQIGYDAAYTDVWSLLLFGALPEDAPVTVSANLTYSLNMAYVVVTATNAPVYAYELRPLPQRLPPGQHRIGNTGNEPFTLSVNLDKPSQQPEYHPGESVQVSYRIEDTRENQLFRLFSFSDARLLFPLVTVTDPDGVVIATNPDSFNFFEYDFQLPTSARQGDYQIEVFLNAQLYGPLVATRRFRVVPSVDKTPPVVSQLAIPDSLESGTPLVAGAQIVDASSLARVAFTVDGKVVPLNAQDGDQYTWKADGLTLGERAWQLEALDTFGNRTVQTGTLQVVDTAPPRLTYQFSDQIELGVRTDLRVSVDDANAIASVVYLYRLPRGEAVSADVSFSHSAVELQLPGIELEGVVEVRAEIQDIAGNTAYLPGPDAEAWLPLPNRDTLAPEVQQVYVPAYIAGEPIHVQAIVTDNHAVAEIYLDYIEADAQVVRLPMTLSGNVAMVDLPPSLSGWEFSVWASDLPDAQGNERSTRSATYRTQARQIAAVVLSPGSSREVPIPVRVGEQLQLQIGVQDMDGAPLQGPIAWTVTGGIGQVDDTGRFVPYPYIRGSGLGEIIATPLLGQRGTQISASAWVQVLPGDLAHIGVIPDRAVMIAGTTQTFLAETTDVYGNHVNAELQWSIDPGAQLGGTVQISDGVHQTELSAVQVGEHQLRLGAGAISAMVPVTILFGQPSGLSTTDTNGRRLTGALKATAGETQNLRARLTDVAGNQREVHPIWYLRGDIGRIDTNGVFQPGRSGSGQILASWDGLVSSLDVNVAAGPLYRITTEPFIDYLPLSTDSWQRTRQFVAHGWDIAGNPVPIQNLRWSTDPAAGTIDASGLFTATSEIGDAIINNVVINGTVYANGESADGRALLNTSVVVILHQAPGPIEHLQITLENFGSVLQHLTLQVGEKREFEVTGLDARNRRWAIRPFWTVEGDIGTITPDGEFTATRPGTGTLIASWEGYSASISLTITPGLLRHLEIAPPAALLRVGESVQLAAEGYDAFGNRVALDQVTWQTADSKRVSFTGNPPTATAVSPGITEMVAHVGDVVAYVPFHIYPSPVRTLRWTHMASILRAGESFQWSVTGTDIAGNTVTIAPRWSLEGHIGSISPTGLLTAESVGQGTVVAEVGSLRITHSIMVVSGALLQLDVTPRWFTLSKGMQQEINAIGRDFFGNPVDITESEWSLIGDGSLTVRGTTAVVSAEEPGLLFITATSSGIPAQAVAFSLEPGDFQPNSLSIIPSAPVSLPTGRTQPFSLWSQDATGSILPVLGYWRVSTGANSISSSAILNAATAGTIEVQGNRGSLQQSTQITITEPAYPTFNVQPPSVSQQIGPSATDTLALMWDRVSLSVGETLPLVSIASAVDGSSHAVIPHWWTTDSALRLGGSNHALAAHPGTAQLHAIWQGQQRTMSVEVVPSAVSFLRLSPGTATFTRLRPGPTRFGTMFYDRFGYVTSAPSQPLTWRTTGGIGNVTGDGVFTAFTDVPQNRQGEVLAQLPQANIAGRAAIYFYGTQSPVAELRLEPSSAVVIPGERFEFHATAFDAGGRVLSDAPDWQVYDAQGQPLANVIRPDGSLMLPVGQFLGQALEVVASLGGVSVTASVTVRAGALARLTVTPAEIVALEIGESSTFKSQGWDTFGNPIAVVPRWYLEGQMGELSPNAGDTVTFRALRSGRGSLSASQSGVSSSVNLIVNPPPLSTLVLLPVAEPPTVTLPGQQPADPWNMQAGDTLQLYAFDRAGQLVTDKLQWRLSSDATLGTLNQSGRFTAQTAGTTHVEASLSSVQANFYLSINAGSLAQIQVIPNTASVLTQETLSFTASGSDKLGNVIPVTPTWSVLGGIGEIDSNGMFTPFAIAADQNWHGTVVASVGALTGTARVSIAGQRGSLAQLSFEAAPTTLAAGATVSLQLQGWDAQGNHLPDINAVMSRSPEVGDLTPLGGGLWRYRAPQQLPEDKQILFIAAAGEIRAEHRLALTPAGISEIRVPDLKVIAGETIRFLPDVHDVFGNVIQNAAIEWEASAGELQLDGQEVVYHHTRSGEVELNAHLGSFEQSFVIEIVPARPATLEVIPSEVRLNAGSTLRMQARLLDTYGNVIDLAATEFSLQESPTDLVDISKVGAAEWEARGIQSGVGQLHWQVGTLSLSIPLIVEAGALKELHITVDEFPQPALVYELTSGGIYHFRGSGVDAEGNLLLPDIQWSLTSDIGQLAPTGTDATLTAQFVGDTKLIASAGGITTEANIRIVPFQQSVDRFGAEAVSPAGVTLNFAPDAVRQTLAVKIDLMQAVQVSEEPGAPAPLDTEPVRLSSIIRIEPADETFARPIALRFWGVHMSPQPGMARQLHFWDAFQQRWLPIGRTVQDDSTALGTQINHLGIFAVMQVESPSRSVNRLAIRHIQVNPPVLYAPDINRATISFRLTTANVSDSVELTAMIYDLHSRKVAMLVDHEAFPAGDASLQWDGRDQSERLVPNGRYVLVIQARSADETATARKLLIVFK